MEKLLGGEGSSKDKNLKGGRIVLKKLRGKQLSYQMAGRGSAAWDCGWRGSLRRLLGASREAQGQRARLY